MNSWLVFEGMKISAVSNPKLSSVLNNNSISKNIAIFFPGVADPGTALQIFGPIIV